jgi:hypothetical protein
MSQIISKIKKSRFTQWAKEYAKPIILGIVTGFLTIGLAVIAFFYGLFAVISKETMLKSLIEAEATILGFFGLIVVYALNSFDNRIDRLEQQLFDTKEKYLDLQDLPKEITKTGEAKVADLNDRLSNIQKKRRKMINTALAVGAYLVSSLLLSILALGMPDILLAFVLCFCAIGIFFVSIVGMFKIFYDLAKSPETA